ncbi:MAG TPA: TatD family hydrolase [Bryobacteraceae bacterium]|nr:TatD family hydrolase [Bryobacteraceae bacterium]
MKLVDSHCHLDSEQFDGDREAVIERAVAAGVERMLTIGSGDGPPDVEAALRLADRYLMLYATIGVHPHDAAKATAQTYKRLAELAAHPKVVAIGEIGLDYHYDHSPREVQRDVFAEQMRIASDARKPIVIHTREAWSDTAALIREHWNPAYGGIIHCFTEGPEEAREALDLGFHVSFAGIVTFPKATGIQEAARMVPAHRLLVETDAPYLAPVPMRGKRNEPAFVVQTARKIAELRGVTPEQIASITVANFERLFLGA